MGSPLFVVAGGLVFVMAAGAALYGIMMAWRAAERAAESVAEVERLRAEVDELRQRLDQGI